MSTSHATPASTDTVVVRAEGLSKSFGDEAALRDLDLELRAGQVVGLLGPNGAGKTTAVNLLSTLLAPDAGTAWVAGADLLEDPQAVRRAIGLAGQAAAVDELLTVSENLRFFGRLYRLPGEVVAGRAGALVERFGMSAYADKPAGELSGGQRRRLDLAVSLIAEPPVVYLDEPTTGLDPRSRADLWAAIEELRDAGAAILLTTQYLEEADRLADWIILLDHGAVVAEGTPSDLKERLERTVLEIHLAEGEALDAVAAALDGVPGVVPVPDEGSVQITIGNGARESLDLLRRIDDAGISIADFTLRQPTLDDVFLTLTDA